MDFKLHPTEVVLCERDRELLERIRDLLERTVSEIQGISIDETDTCDLVDVDKEIGTV